jgi:hypothetical protein
MSKALPQVTTTKKCRSCGLRGFVLEDHGCYRYLCSNCGVLGKSIGYQQLLPQGEDWQERKNKAHWENEEEQHDVYSCFQDHDMQLMSNKIIQGYRGIKDRIRQVSVIRPINQSFVSDVTYKWKVFVRDQHEFLHQKHKSKYYEVFAYWAILLSQDVDFIIQFNVNEFRKELSLVRANAAVNVNHCFPSDREISSIYAFSWIKQIAITTEGEDVLRKRFLKLIKLADFSGRTSIANLAAGCVWLMYDFFRGDNAGRHFLRNNGIKHLLNQRTIASITGCKVPSFAAAASIMGTRLNEPTFQFSPKTKEDAASTMSARLNEPTFQTSSLQVVRRLFE